VPLDDRDAWRGDLIARMVDWPIVAVRIWKAESTGVLGRELSAFQSRMVCGGGEGPSVCRYADM
jgi:hypothetical protein